MISLFSGMKPETIASAASALTGLPAEASAAEIWQAAAAAALQGACGNSGIILSQLLCGLAEGMPFTHLAPGDVIATGTPGGVGFARTPPVWMEPGDLIEVTVEKVGTIRNRIVAEQGAPADWRWHPADKPVTGF